MINDVIGELQLAKVDHILHPMFSHGGTIGMQIDPALEMRLRFRRSGEGPASGALIRDIVVISAAISTVLMPAVGSWCYLHQDIVTLPFLQAAHVYLD
jgi:hypothetical protein